MSELVREALRQYESKQWWQSMNAYGRPKAEERGLDRGGRRFHRAGSAQAARPEEPHCKVIRIVVDTNVYISALVFGGKPASALQEARKRVESNSSHRGNSNLSSSKL